MKINATVCKTAWIQVKLYNNHNADGIIEKKAKIICDINMVSLGSAINVWLHRK